MKAIYEAKVEIITIIFDSSGGSSVDSITINKGAELTLPDAPTYKGYKFVTWEYEDKTPIEDKTKLDEDTKLYAKWEKIENKKEEKKKETPKKEPVKKEEPAKKPEENISISVSRSTFHRNGYSTSSAIASVKNANLNGVVYSLIVNGLQLTQKQVQYQLYNGIKIQVIRLIVNVCSQVKQ